jgi:hypothetical protein
VTTYSTSWRLQTETGKPGAQSSDLGQARETDHQQTPAKEDHNGKIASSTLTIRRGQAVRAKKQVAVAGRTWLAPITASRNRHDRSLQLLL